MGKSTISMAMASMSLFVCLPGHFIPSHEWEISRILKWRYVNAPYFRPYFVGIFPEI